MVVKKLVWAPLSSPNFSTAIENTLSILSDESSQNKKDKYLLMKHQKIVRAYMNPETPYRGILLYHGLGSGKTCSAIAITEQFKQDKKAIILLPGPTLEDNFIHELEKCGNKEYTTSHRHWVFQKMNLGNKSELETRVPKQTIEELGGGWTIEPNQPGNFSKLTKKEQQQVKKQIDHKIRNHYEIVRYKGISQERLETFIRTNYFDNKLIVVDEAHNVISMMVNYIFNSEDDTSHMRGRFFYKLFTEAHNARFIFLTGTPIINFPRELAVIFNVLRGHTTVYRWQLSETDGNYDKLRNFPYIDWLKITGNKLQLTRSQYGFAIKDGNITRDDEAPMTGTEWISRFKSFVKINNIKLDIDKAETEDFKCLPIDDNFDTSFINDDNTIKNAGVLKRRITGLVSHYGSQGNDTVVVGSNGEKIYKKKNFPTMTIHPLQELDMSINQYIQYEKERLIEIHRDAKKAMRKPTFEDQGRDTTTFRARSLALCNFAFPPSVNPEEPITKDNRDRMILDLKNKLDVYVKDVPDNKLDTLKQLSPKYWTIKEKIEKTSGTKVIYSHLVNREGLTSMFSILERCGWKQLRIYENKKTKSWTCTHGGDKTYVLYGDNDGDERERLRKIFNSDMDSLPKSLREALPAKTNLHGEIVKAFFITASGAEGITLKNVREIHVVEHYWSEVRIDQVIGRVNRLNSHAALPENERTVDVFKYATVFGKEVLDYIKNNTTHQQLFDKITKQDGVLTSDQKQIATAQRKRFINDQLLECIRSASIDCALHKIQGCYQLDNNSFEPSFDNHLKNSSINQAPQIQLKKIVIPKRAWVPSRFRGKEHLLDETTNTLYDIDSVKINRPKKIATYNKADKQFLLI
tara:strand:+ start:3265 stop:5847 length:2583 start_codon:yes stop_codon:yes gene_type:complete